MIEFEANHFDIVGEHLAGDRRADETVMACVDTLSERLERLNALGGLFASVEFSPEVAELAARRSAVAVA